MCKAGQHGADCKAIVVPKHKHGHRAAMLHFSYTCACCRRGLHDELPLVFRRRAFLYGLASWVWGMQKNIWLSSWFVCFRFVPPSLFLVCVPSLCVSLFLSLGLPLCLLSVNPVCVPLLHYSFPLSASVSVPAQSLMHVYGQLQSCCKSMCRSRAHSAASGLSHT